MKHLFVTLTLALTLISLSSFANDENVAPAALKSFNSSFKNVADVKWSASDNYYKADFLMNGQYVSAYYNCDGDLLALGRNLSSTELPLVLQADLKKSYGDYWITDLFEVANNEGTSYYVTIENADTKLVLKSADTQWNTYKKQKKA